MLNTVDSKRISVQQGQYKSYKMPILYSDQKKYVIWCKGNYELIQKVLPNPLHVGKKHAVGFGECTYEIEMQRNNKSNALMCKGYLQRPLPVNFCKERNWKPVIEHIEQRPISPPYFGQDCKYEKCYAGGLKLKTKNENTD